MAVLVLAQAAQGPVAAPAELARREQATVDAAVQAAMVADALPRRDAVEVRPQGPRRTHRDASAVEHGQIRRPGGRAPRRPRWEGVGPAGGSRDAWIEVRGVARRTSARVTGAWRGAGSTRLRQPM